MPIVQTRQGPKPTIPLASGLSSGLATPSYPFLPGGRGVGLVAGRTISFARIFRTQPAVASVLRRHAEQAARIPIHGFEYLDPEQDARRRVRDHPAVALLGRPRPRVPGVRLRWAISLGLKIHGNYVLWKRRPRRGAPPFELWPLDFRLVQPHLDGDTGRVVAWEWQGQGIPGLKRGELVFPEDTLHFAWDAPDGELGISPLEQLGVTVRSEDAIQRYAEAGWRNGTRFGVGVILDKAAKSDKVSRDGVREEIIAAHGGVDQAFRPAILGGGIIDVKPLGGQTAAEAELIQQRKINREEVAAVIGLPQPLAGILDHATYSNVSELLAALFTTFLAPELSLTSGILQAQLIDDEPAWAGDDIFVDHNLAEVLKADLVKRYNAYKLALAAGFLVLNDVRRLENLEPYADPLADQPLVLGNNVVPLSKLGALPRPSTPVEQAAQAARLEALLKQTLEEAGHNGDSGPLSLAAVGAALNGSETS